MTTYWCFLKDSELTELKDTIDILKAKNTEAQEIIQGALSNPDVTPKGTDCTLWYTVGFWLSYTSVSLFNSSIFFWVFRAADQPPELLRKPLQSYQHHQPLEHGQPQGAGGQEEEEEELGEETLVTD